MIPLWITTGNSGAGRYLLLCTLLLCLLACQQSIPSPEPLLEPSPTQSALIQAYARRDADDLQGALYYLERDAYQNGWTAEHHRQAGRLWLEAGSTPRALSHFRLAVQTSDDLNFMRQVCDMLLSVHDFGQARAIMTRMLTIAPDDAWAHFHTGALLVASDAHQAEQHLRVIVRDAQYGEIARDLLHVLTLDADTPHPEIYIAQVFVDAELWLYAELAFLNTSGRYYPFPEALAYAGLMRDFQGKDGESYLQSALALAPDNPDVLLIQGMRLRLKGQLAPSQTVLLYALSLSPDNPLLNAELGRTYQKMGLLDEAQEALQRAMALSGNDPVFESSITQFYAEEAYRLPGTVFEDLSQRSNMQPQSATVMAQLAWALHIRGESEAASQKLEQALQIEPDNPDALFNKARILLDNGLSDSAIDLLETLADGTSPYALTARTMLQNLRG